MKSMCACIESWCSELRSWRSELRSWRSELRSWRSEPVSVYNGCHKKHDAHIKSIVHLHDKYGATRTRVASWPCSDTPVALGVFVQLPLFKL